MMLKITYSVRGAPGIHRECCSTYRLFGKFSLRYDNVWIVARRLPGSIFFDELPQCPGDVLRPARDSQSMCPPHPWCSRTTPGALSAANPSPLWVCLRRARPCCCRYDPIARNVPVGDALSFAADLVVSRTDKKG